MAREPREPRVRPSGNNPPPLSSRIRLVVKARPQLPKRFIWEIVQDDGNGAVTVQRSAHAYGTMATAYEKGWPILLAVRSRHDK